MERRRTFSRYFSRDFSRRRIEGAGPGRALFASGGAGRAASPCVAPKLLSAGAGRCFYAIFYASFYAGAWPRCLPIVLSAWRIDAGASRGKTDGRILACFAVSIPRTIPGNFAGRERAGALLFRMFLAHPILGHFCNFGIRKWGMLAALPRLIGGAPLGR